MTVTEVRRVLAELGLRPSRALGQNFLVDDHIVEIIVRAADIRGDETVLEIGPGLGALTAALLNLARRVIAIEKDPRLCEYLRRRFPELELVQGDALSVLASPPPDWPAVTKVVANLPYSVATPLMERFVEATTPPRLMVLTVQREVAQRLAASPRQKQYGALSLFTQLHYHVTIAHIVGPRCFYPAPRVESAVVVLERRRPRVALQPGAPFHELVRAAFQQRRKMLRNRLAEFGPMTAAFAAAGVSPTARAEELTLEQWIALANALAREKSG